MIHHRHLVPWLLTGLLALTLSGPAAAQDADGEPLNVVTTFSILDDLVRNVGGEAIDSHALVEVGTDAHTYEPAPNDVATLAEADLVFAIGLDFEPWLDGLLESSGTAATRVTVSDNVAPLRVEDEDEAPGDDGPADTDEREGEAPGELDPHIWHDVTNTVIMVESIRDALIAADPANAATYEANAASYIGELESLDAWVMDRVATLPADQRKLVTSHETLAYFAHRYGFELIGTAFGTVSTESGDPSAAAIANLVEEIEAQQVPAIFAENTSNPDLMEAVAAEAGVTLAPALFTDALGGPGSGAETYLDLIRANTETIVTALTGN